MPRPKRSLEEEVSDPLELAILQAIDARTNGRDEAARLLNVSRKKVIDRMYRGDSSRPRRELKLAEATKLCQEMLDLELSIARTSRVIIATTQRSGRRRASTARAPDRDQIQAAGFSS